MSKNRENNPYGEILGGLASMGAEDARAGELKTKPEMSVSIGYTDKPGNTGNTDNISNTNNTGKGKKARKIDNTGKARKKGNTGKKETAVVCYRIPADLADAIGRIAYWQRRTKQDVVAEAFLRYIETVPEDDKAEINRKH